MSASFLLWWLVWWRTYWGWNWRKLIWGSAKYYSGVRRWVKKREKQDKNREYFQWTRIYIKLSAWWRPIINRRSAKSFINKSHVRYNYLNYFSLLIFLNYYLLWKFFLLYFYLEFWSFRLSLKILPKFLKILRIFRLIKTWFLGCVNLFRLLRMLKMEWLFSLVFLRQVIWLVIIRSVCFG